MIGLRQYAPSDRDTWSWQRATLGDVTDIVDLAQQQFQTEIDQFLVPDPALYARNLSLAVIRQTHNPLAENLTVARDRATNQLRAYGWVDRGGYTEYSATEFGEAKFAHVDLALSDRQRVTLLAQMLHQWYLWCQICQIPVLVSTSIRSDQSAFMRLHQRAGFDVRGSIAYIRVR